MIEYVRSIPDLIRLLPELYRLLPHGTAQEASSAHQSGSEDFEFSRYRVRHSTRAGLPESGLTASSAVRGEAAKSLMLHETSA